MKSFDDIIIFFEHKDREYDAALALSTILNTKFNLSVKIFSVYFDLFKIIFLSKPKIVILPYCRSQKNIVVRLFKLRFFHNVKFINLNYEQLLSHYTKIIKKPQDNFSREELYHFSWGSYFVDYLLSNNVNSNNIFITGKIENTILKYNYFKNRTSIRKYISNKFNLNTRLKWVFLPLNDGVLFEKASILKKSIKRGYANSNGFIFKKFINKTINELLLSLATNNFQNEYLFIIRPHPSVSIDDYYFLIKSLNMKMPQNVKFIRDLSSKEWISTCDYCISNYSTVILDSAYLGIPSFIYEPFKRPDFSKTDWIELFPHITNLLSFRDYPNNHENYKNIISNYIATETNSIQTTAEVIFKILKNKPNHKSFSKISLSIKDFIKVFHSLFLTIDVITRFKGFYIFNKSIIYDYVSKREIMKRKETIIKFHE
jgi:surface carbohydrate biosynthesis protein